MFFLLVAKVKVMCKIYSSRQCCLFCRRRICWNKSVETRINIVRMKYQITFRYFWRLIVKAAITGLIFCLGVLLYISWDLPSINSLPNTYMHPSVRITDRNGRLLYEIIPQEGGRSAVLSIENIPQCLIFKF